ncbi:hypothetical protein [Pseudoxanthomonas mexicana]|uniref:hypothetical protein n=1 Tax=Pseudoxanthomonas mexicana TaxID=128785 RepID=UPI000DAFA3F1|nr:hypothetical protein [Pseudoxanthomonas mexicana]KAF1727977.1 hypothetical protein CSC76_07685 [Pseudoxanthomonas mexicana]PZQ32606.1 MAG: hypothetical protein DI562_03190 [Stenotrophomonas acidaminiphila]
MLTGLDASIWMMLLVTLLLPITAIVLLKVVFRKRGGIGTGWGGILVVMFAGLMAVVVILDKVGP